MDIRLITENKGDYIPLLLLADEQTDMIENTCTAENCIRFMTRTCAPFVC